MYDWGDLKIFLATARAGSMLAAASELGVNQTTVARRIAALESSLRVRLFNRNRDGCRLSEAGINLLAQAERVADEAETLERLAAQDGRQLSGVIRVTASDIVANIVVNPMLVEFFERYPDIKVELITTDRRLNLARGEADIAIRGADKPVEPGAVVRKLANGRWSLFCSRGYAAKRSAPKCAEDLKGHLIVGADGVLAKHPPYIWLTEVAPRAKVLNVCSTMINAISAIRSGHGVGPLPGWASGIAEWNLIECFTLPQFQFGYYLLTRADKKDVPRVRVFTDFMAARGPIIKAVLEGVARKDKSLGSFARRPPLDKAMHRGARLRK
jgi:DNA-binding transcriptional LysR family regulator